MINIAVILREGAKENEEKILASLPHTVREKIEDTRCEREQELRLAAYGFVGEKFTEQVQTIVYTKNKPCFEKYHPVFNISHSEDFAVVAYSSDESIESLGVDVQCDPKKKTLLARIAERFFPPFEKVEKKEESCPIASVVFYKIGDGGTYEEYEWENKRISYPEAKSDLLAKWTVLEAVLKASGGGFEDYPESEEKLSSTPTESFIFRDSSGRKYALTVAFVPKETE